MMQITKSVNVSLRALLVFSVLTGAVYPLAVTVIAQLLFPHAANGSLVKKGSEVVGSELLVQKFANPKYFLPRPSGGDFATMPSGSSNLSATSDALKQAVEQRRRDFGKDAPADLLTTSGSGLDPDISMDAAKIQIPKVLAARGRGPGDAQKIEDLIQTLVTVPQFGILGISRINVLALNMKLDEILP